MKKQLEAELISIAHRILRLSDRSTLPILQQEAKNLYEKLTILTFAESHFTEPQPTIGQIKSVFDEDPKIEIEATKITSKEIEETVIEVPEEDKEVAAIVESSEFINEEVYVDSKNIEVVEDVFNENIFEEEDKEIVDTIGDSEFIDEVVNSDSNNIEVVEDVFNENVFEEEDLEIASTIGDSEFINQENTTIINSTELQEDVSNENMFDTLVEVDPLIETSHQEERKEIEDIVTELKISNQEAYNDPEQVEDVFQEISKEDEEIVAKPEIIIEKINEKVTGDLFVPLTEVTEENTIPTPLDVENDDQEEIITTSDVGALEADDTPKSLNDQLKKGIHIGLNDRLAFIKYLFDGSSTDYNRVLSQLNTLDSHQEAIQFIDDMVKPDYNNWNGKEEYEERFINIVLHKYES